MNYTYSNTCCPLQLYNRKRPRKELVAQEGWGENVQKESLNHKRAHRVV
jgi:hypothetical protein